MFFVLEPRTWKAWLVLIPGATPTTKLQILGQDQRSIEHFNRCSPTIRSYFNARRMKISTRQRQHPTELVSPGRVRKLWNVNAHAHGWGVRQALTPMAVTDMVWNTILQLHLAFYANQFLLCNKRLMIFIQSLMFWSLIGCTPKKGLPSDMRAQSQDQNICNKRLCPFQKNEHILPLWLP